MIKFEIKSKKTGLVTHSFLADKMPDVNKAWGDPSEFDVIQSDVTDEIAYVAAVKKQYSLISTKIPDFVAAFIAEKDGDSSLMTQFISDYKASLGANPVPTKPNKPNLPKAPGEK